jgi:hypothetical protein
MENSEKDTLLTFRQHLSNMFQMDTFLCAIQKADLRTFMKEKHDWDDKTFDYHLSTYVEILATGK